MDLLDRPESGSDAGASDRCNTPSHAFVCNDAETAAGVKAGDTDTLDLVVTNADNAPLAVHVTTTGFKAAYS